MNFKELKQGYSLHILDKPAMAYKIAKVTSVSLPHVDSKLTATGMVVDITTEAGTFCALADTDTAYPMNSVISTDLQSILREVEALKTTSEQLLSQVDTHKQTIAKCNKLLASLDPVQKEKQAVESRFANIETSISKMMDMLTKLTT